MGTNIQKITILIMSAAGISLSICGAQAAPTRQCGNGAILVGTKQIGQVSYFAESCKQNWENQSIQMNFSYSQNIPEWAFKRAATHFLNKNISDFKAISILNQITQLYKPVKNGDVYTLSYVHSSQTLTLSLNGKILGHIQNQNANQYFRIWLGSEPFSVKLKQQLLN
ncbi:MULTISPECIES: chalcone isomerase family protein [unclassified Acinetobacter]|uniref:chalcone isomerase family protein n=1 Tax=unclassified Acinetobacter TaxID=196816 RepID=UPI0018A8BE33|nr:MULTISPECIES: chalcone isomerase family protein [unclassified Acinetobacter]MBJ9952218.1 chalcone isomerase family protein [Acinetobacter baumannii]